MGLGTALSLQPLLQLIRCVQAQYRNGIKSLVVIELATDIQTFGSR